MINKIKYILLVLLISPSFLFGAKGPEDQKKANSNQGQNGLAAGCTPASQIIYLEFNNVKTRVEAGGLWWQDRPNSQADYEVPVNSNSYALYAGGLWLAGTDVNGQLKAAASKFGTGVDYWTGPLDTSGTAEVSEKTCGDYDRFFQISRAEVAQFVAYNNAITNGDVAEKFPDYQIPNSILDWPGNGNVSLGEDFRLAPYVNVGGDISYEPSEGDYPNYDLEGTVDCRANRTDRSESSLRPLFGDKTYWWVFNDKGNLHTESNAPSIGMEIHGQAFAFATNDAVNDMTFYNFELINRSTFTLTDTYFASYVDPDLGNPSDDYVGCDVARGLGFCYNGDEVDEDFRGQTGYGSTPAAIGIDFFEGPYQDADGLNNNYGIKPGEALNGLGYFNPDDREPDTVPDNERFGMRRFVYYQNSTGNNGDPTLAIHYYNYMRGIWKNGQKMKHGGNGFNSAAVEDINTAFMFPGDSDPLKWGTTDPISGVTQTPNNDRWTEDYPGAGEEQNQPNDRRFLQSAGPFTLRPGNVNDITVGVVFAQAESGGRLASVDKLFLADDKAQALFDNCFQVLNGPDAPVVDVQELSNQLIFYISNPETSNNQEELGLPYLEEDPNIITPEYLADQVPPIYYDQDYRFQGYQVFQLAGPGISVNDVDDLDKARLVFQCDIRDGVVDLVNFTFDEELGANIPRKKVVASNNGIRRSFTLTQDLFATGNNRLINFKTYYYIAIAYGFNEFKPYLQGTAPDSANPFAPAFDGQTQPYISSRKGADGGSVTPFTAIPHDPTSEEGGTVVNSAYGQEIQITRLQGTGNGGRALQIAESSMNNLLEEKAWEDPMVEVGEIDYVAGIGPFTVTVADPLNVIDGTFYMQLLDETKDNAGDPVITDSSEWKIWLEGGTAEDTIYSAKSIETENDQLLFSPNWGLSISIVNGVEPGTKRPGTMNGFISATMEFESAEKTWLSGVPDTDFEGPQNWVLAGTVGNSPYNGFFNDYFNGSNSSNYVDPDEEFESILGGIIAPYRLTRYVNPFDNVDPEMRTVNAVGNSNTDVAASSLNKLNSVAIVITRDKTKWSRCPVVETATTDPGEGFVRGKVKQKLSVDKNGIPVDTTGHGGESLSVIDTLLASNNEEDAGFGSAVGMGWFPGYVINKETGERLNIIFGEDSKYSFNNGNDMIWNPNSQFQEGIFPSINNVWGGKHFTYIFRKTADSEIDPNLPASIRDYIKVHQYDNGASLRRLLGDNNATFRKYGWNNCMWAAVPFLTPGQELLSTDVLININVSKQFATKDSEIDPNIEDSDKIDNNSKPVYRFRTSGVAVQKAQKNVLKDQLSNMNVVPNPYYGISEYETSQLDNTVKFTNLPEVCTIKIYNTNGTLIRTYKKSDPNNFLDWNLKNQVGIPIASGVYIIHIDVPNVGEKVLKWFGVIRPVDLNNF